MAGISAIQQYGESSSSDDDDDVTKIDIDAGSKSLAEFSPTLAHCLIPTVNATPDVFHVADIGGSRQLAVSGAELSYNRKFDDLFAPLIGPENPYRTQMQKAKKNTLTGFAEAAEVCDFHFETQRKTFHSYGYAHDPSTDRGPSASCLIGDVVAAKDEQEKTVFETKKPRTSDDRKRVRNMDPSDLEGYTGPWGGYVDEEKIARPDEETMKILDEFAAKKKKYQKVTKDDTMEEKSVLHIDDPYDYQGRSFLCPPQDIDGVNLKSDSPPSKCFIPKKQLHVWDGHNKAVHAIRWFPKTAHLLLSCSMDCRIKMWEVYKQRRCVRTYNGHRQAVRDACFDNEGTTFLSASYDRFVKLWDTETGQCKQRFTTGKVPYCVKFNPDENKQNLFLSGMADKKIVQWDIRSGEIVQEYDRHLGSVNTVTFFDNNRRFCSTSDDKSLRIWEWDIPVDTKLIQDSSMHSMPSVTMAPNAKWLACQSMDNKVVVFQVIDDKIRLNRRKQFAGHMVAGYACSVDFSPDMSYLVSGDADGKVWIWNWKNHKVAAKWKAHESVCISCLWHPHETSKLATASWDGKIKLWD